MFFGYIDANSVQNAKQLDNDQAKLDAVTFSQRDLDAINRIAGHSNTFGLLCKSICPTIYGHDMVKGKN